MTRQDFTFLLAPDKFKGCLTAAEVVASMKAGICEVYPRATILSCPVADGGDGTLDILVSRLHGVKKEFQVSDPHKSRVTAEIGFFDDGRSAIIESSQAIGLRLLPAGHRDPLGASSEGVGELIRFAMREGAVRIFIALGGSATTDAGMGMAKALGYNFFDKAGNELRGCGSDLCILSRIEDSPLKSRLEECEFTILSDVTNPLYGLNGAATVFAPQKGATAEQVKLLDTGLRNFSHLAFEQFGFDLSDLAGGGAAGGLGAAFSLFCSAKIQSGASFVLDAVGFDTVLSQADFVFSGEGCIDRQTVDGKLIDEIARRCALAGTPLFIFAGGLKDCEKLNHEYGKAAFFSIAPGPAELEKLLESASVNLKNSCYQVTKVLSLI